MPRFAWHTQSLRSENACPPGSDFLGLAAGLRPSPNWALPPWNPHSCRRGLGGQGEERPLPPLTEAGSFRGRQGAESSPLRVCGPHQPLDPHSIRSGRGSRFAQRPRSGPDLDALERPQRSGLVVRGALPLTACHVANGQAPLGGRVSGGEQGEAAQAFGTFGLLAHVKISLTQGLFERSLRSKV